MHAIPVTAAQAPLVLAGRMRLQFLPVGLHVRGVAEVARIAGPRYAALDARSRRLETLLAPLWAGERAYLAEPWSIVEHAGRPPVRYQAEEPGERSTTWAPPALMPANASRARLVVQTVDVVRLHSLAGRDIVLAGGWTPPPSPPPWPACGSVPKGECVDLDYLRNALARRVDQLHGHGTWAANPWVWRVEFRLAAPPQPQKAASNG